VKNNATSSRNRFGIGTVMAGTLGGSLAANAAGVAFITASFGER
jgi:hypothetical protein